MDYEEGMSAPEDHLGEGHIVTIAALALDPGTLESINSPQVRKIPSKSKYFGGVFLP